MNWDAPSLDRVSAVLHSGVHQDEWYMFAKFMGARNSSPNFRWSISCESREQNGRSPFYSHARGSVFIRNPFPWKPVKVGDCLVRTEFIEVDAEMAAKILALGVSDKGGL